MCYEHLAEDVTVKTPTLSKFKSTLKPVTIIVPDSQKVIKLSPVAIFETLTTSRKPQKPRVLREDELDDLKKRLYIELRRRHFQRSQEC